MSVTSEDLRRLRHMLGATNIDEQAKWGWRNYFLSGRGEQRASMLRLVAAALAVQGETTADEAAYFHATYAGCVAAGLSVARAAKACHGEAMQQGTKYETTTLQTLRIVDAPGLDPIRVVIEDIAPHRGRIIIQCYTDAWTAYFGNMGPETLPRFFAAMSADVLASNLDVGLKDEIWEGEHIKASLVREILKRRRLRQMSKDEAIEWYAEITENHFYDDPHDNHEIIERVLGQKWWHVLPKAANPRYTYLLKIIVAIQHGLHRQFEKEEGTDV